MEPVERAGAATDRFHPGIQPIPETEAEATAERSGADLVGRAEHLDAVVAARRLPVPVSPTALAELRALALRLAVAERIVVATRARAARHLGEQLVRRGPAPDPEPARGSGPGPPDPPAAPSWDPGAARRRGLAAVLVGVGAGFVAAGLGAPAWALLPGPLLGLLVASRLLRRPSGPQRPGGAPGGDGPVIRPDGDRPAGVPALREVAGPVTGAPSPSVPAARRHPEVTALAAETPAARAASRLLDLVHERWSDAWLALGQELPRPGEAPEAGVDALAARAGRPVVLVGAAVSSAGRAAAALPAAPVLVAGGSRHDGSEGSARAPAPGRREPDAVEPAVDAQAPGQDPADALS